MAFKDDLEALSTTDIALTGDGWGPKVSELLTKLLPALQEMATAVESNKTEIDNNAITAASSDLSNVNESDIVRRVLNNPASIANGTLLQVRDGLIEPLAQSSLDFPGPNFEVGERASLRYRVGNRAPTNQDYSCLLYTSPSPRDS